MNRSIVFVVAICLLAVFAGFKLVATPTPSVFPKVTKVQSADHAKWYGDVTLVKYSDFQCPACKAYDNYIDQIEKTSSHSSKIQKKFKFIFRNYPLSFHKNALPAAQAAEAAALQGKFWEMKKELFKAQESWSASEKPLEDYFQVFAKNIGIDVPQFTQDYRSTRVSEKIKADIASGDEAKLDATPTFYLNGKKLFLRESETLEQILLESIKK